LWALVDVATDARFLSFRSFGLISPLVGFLCLLVSLAALHEAARHRSATWHALGASVLSIVIGVVPFFALPFDPS
jgi:Mg2+/citrate symporter